MGSTKYYELLGSVVIERETHAFGKMNFLEKAVRKLESKAAHIQQLRVNLVKLQVSSSKELLKFSQTNPIR